MTLKQYPRNTQQMNTTSTRSKIKILEKGLRCDKRDRTTFGLSIIFKSHHSVPRAYIRWGFFPTVCEWGIIALVFRNKGREIAN